jgi:hypothetical protein
MIANPTHKPIHEQNTVFDLPYGYSDPDQNGNHKQAKSSKLSVASRPSGGPLLLNGRPLGRVPRFRPVGLGGQALAYSVLRLGSKLFQLIVEFLFAGNCSKRLVY